MLLVTADERSAGLRRLAGRSLCDGIVLMDDTCLLGPTQENHIRCRDWRESVLLYRRDGELWCKSRQEIRIDGQAAPAAKATAQAPAAARPVTVGILFLALPEQVISSRVDIGR